MSLTPKASKLRRLFGRSPSPLPIGPSTPPVSTPQAAPASTRASAPQPQAGPAYTRNGSSILEDALEALDPKDRETIRPLLTGKVVSVDNAFDDVYGKARELQQRCSRKRWPWTYKGRPVYINDTMDKVVQLLDKFMSVGDVIANVDPIHVGLPWAGIRVILEVCTHGRSVSFRQVC